MNYDLVSGTDSVVLHFPADAEVHVTGTVKNSTSNWLFPSLAWQLNPLVSASTLGTGQTATVDTTWTNGASDQDVTVTFEQLPGTAASDYEWDLHLSSSGSGCPPATPQACSKAGGNVFYAEPTIVDGEQREGCYKDDTSCIEEIPIQVEATQCDPNDIFTETMAAGPAYLAVLSGGILLVAGSDASGVGIGSTLPFLGNPWVLAAAALIVVGAVAIRYVLPTTTQQGADAVDALPGVVSEAMDDNPDLGPLNPGFPTNLQQELNVQQAVDLCVSTLPISVVIARAAEFPELVGGTIDPSTGVVTFPNKPAAHLCSLIPVYYPGGSTRINNKRMVSASLHIRDVLTGEHNGPETQTGNPSTPQIGWSVLTKATHPTGTSDRDWRLKVPYKCSGDGNAVPKTACDEWPWYATAEGGPGAHLRIIDYDENSRGGADYRSFTSGTGCSIGDGGSFVVMPLPAWGINAELPSMATCLK